MKWVSLPTAAAAFVATQIAGCASPSAPSPAQSAATVTRTALEPKTAAAQHEPKSKRSRPLTIERQVRATLASGRLEEASRPEPVSCYPDIELRDGAVALNYTPGRGASPQDAKLVAAIRELAREMNQSLAAGTHAANLPLLPPNTLALFESDPTGARLILIAPDALALAALHELVARSIGTRTGFGLRQPCDAPVAMPTTISPHPPHHVSVVASRSEGRR
jgi:hypothetical protein